LHGEGDNCRYSHDPSDCPYGVACRRFQRGCCIYGDRCRDEHGKPVKQEEVPAADLTAKSSLAPSSSLSLAAGPVVEMNMGEAKSRNSNSATVGAGSEDWVNAIELVPGAPPQGSATKEELEKEQTATGTKKQLWPSAAGGECPYRENRVYLHGDSCDRCGLRVLHLMDAAQRSQHRRSCSEAHGKDVELSSAVQHSKDVVCGICMEVVYEKANPSECHFGIVTNCNPTYCLKCIRKWRSAKQLESEIIKSCPQCRIPFNCHSK
uniref:RING-type E3 ubiquitin transferase n=1 Tax=Canis lupus dingo TaxID=286419 RepID=A0A8C0R6G0_CANLU